MPSQTSSLNNSNISSQLVRAGAGAGKTTRLVETLLKFAENFEASQGRFPRVLICTFTRKATQELRERILKKAIENQKPKLVDFVMSRSQLHISTIHGALALFLNEVSSQMNWGASFGFLSRSEAFRMDKEALLEILESFPQADLLLGRFKFSKLLELCRWSKQQVIGEREQNYHRLEEHLQVLEAEWLRLGAETLLISEKILAESSQEKIVKFAEELKVRGLAFSKGRSDGLFDQELLRGFPVRPRRNKKNPPYSEEIFVRLEELYQDLKTSLEDSLFSIDHLNVIVETHGTLAELFQLFWQKTWGVKKELGKIEMEDIEALSLDFLRQSPELVRRFSETWDYWMVDEYQDTSPRQVHLLDRFIGQSPFFKVGDPQQSIYLFRGAQSEVFENEEKRMKEFGQETICLARNYRSEPQLLEFFNCFFQSINSSAFTPMSPGRETEKSDRPVAYFLKTQAPENKTTELAVGETSTEATTEAEVLLKPEDHSFEFRSALLSHIQVLMKDHGAQFQDICILARTNRLLEETQEVLQSAKIPLQFHSSGNYWQRSEMKDALSLLRFLVNPHDDFNSVALFRSPWFRIADESLIDLRGKSKEKSYWSLCNEFLAADPIVQKMTRAFQDIEEMGLGTIYRELLFDCEIFKWCFTLDPTGRREANLWKFIDQIREVEKEGKSYLEFLRDIQLGISIDLDSDGSMDAASALEPSSLQLMTIHASKGLQFPHIILLGCGKSPQTTRSASQFFDSQSGRWWVGLPLKEGQANLKCLTFQASLRRQAERELEESERLLYVALTRAEKSVSLFWEGERKVNSWLDRLGWELGVVEEGNRKGIRWNIDTGPWPELPKLAHDDEVSEPVMTPYQPVSRESAEFEKKVFHRKSVTQIVNPDSSQLNRDREKFEQLAATRPPQRSLAQLRRVQLGVHFHRFMEAASLENLSLENWNQFGLSGESGLNSREAQDVLLWLRELDEPPFSQVLAEGEREWGFQFLDQGELVEGQIDLWGKDQNGETWLIDYKTGSIRSKDRSRAQLEVYEKALRKFGVSGEIKKAVLYVFDSQVDLF